MTISKSYKKFITKKEYQQLLNYQTVHQYFMNCLEKLELDALEITQEINNDVDSELFLGGLTSSILYSQNEQGLIDGLKFLDIEIEKDKIIENKKEIGKVTKKKKKFKSGEWARNKSLDVHKEIIDRPEFHIYLNEFINPDYIVDKNILDDILLIGNPEKLLNSGRDMFDAIRNANFGHILVDENEKEIVDDMNKNDIFDYDNLSEDESGAMG